MPSFRVFIAATGLSFAVVFATALTLALPGSGAAQEPEEEPGAQVAQVTSATATLILSSYLYDFAIFTVSGHTTAWWIKADTGPDSSACNAGSQSPYIYRAQNLTHNTTYTYTAYSDNTCTTQLGSPVTFKTLEKNLAAIEIGQNRVRLQLEGLQRASHKAYIKGDGAAPHNTCTKFDDIADRTGPQGNQRIEDTLTLTGLDPNTSYTYRSWDYLPSNVKDCATGTEASVMTFTTLPAELTVQSLGPNSVGLRLTGHKGRDWYYQSTAGPSNRPHQTCTLQAGNSPNPINTLNLGGLATDMEYTYKAYTDSACTAGNELDDDGVTFTTLATAPTLTVSYVSPTTAKLTIAGYTGNWYLTADSWHSGACGYSNTNVVYLTDLTPGVTYTFKAVAPVPGQGCNAAMAAAAPFTTPALLPECDGLSIVAAGVTSTAWMRYVEVENNTDDAIHDVRVFTYYVTGSVISGIDPLYHSRPYEVTIPELAPRATVRNEHTSNSFKALLAELNGVVQLVDPVNRSAVLCETAIEPSWWGSRGITFPKVSANPGYRVSTQLDNPLPGAGETATFTVTAYATTYDQLLQACVNLDFDGLVPVDADGDGDHDVVIYDGPNGKYKEDGTLNQDNQGNDLGFRRAGRLGYDSDGYDEDVANWRYRPQCSDAAGKFQGGLFRIGNTERRTDPPPHQVMYPVEAEGLTYTVKVPVTATGSGSGCLTATVRALPPERSDTRTILNPNPVTAYEKAQDNTAKACLGAPPSDEPALPALFQEGRADTVSLYTCADGERFPCAGKSADDLAQYVDGSSVAVDGSGNAATNSGSLYRAFYPENVVVHVADLTTTNDPAGGRTVRKHPASPSKVVWYTGSDRADDPSDSNDFGILPGVSTHYHYLGAAYKPHVWSICDRHRPDYVKDGTGAVCDSTAPVTNPGNIRGIYYKSWTLALLDDTKASQPSYSSNSSSTGRSPIVFEFDALGTYVTDIVREGTQGSGTRKAANTYTFHVGPAADLSVRAGGASTSVVSGKRAFTIIAESEATAEIDASRTHHGHTDLINLGSLLPAVTVTANDAAIPAANISQVGATAGRYDTATGVWTLPDGWQGRAALTLLADASAVSSVTAKIANSAEVCENDAGTAVTTVDTRAAVDRATCEFNKNGTSSGNHWGAYQRCIKPDAGAYGANPHGDDYTSDKDTCEANVTNGTWHTTEWYDWRPANNTVTFTPDDTGFTLNARGAGRTSIDLRWQQRAGADSYAIYSASTADLTSTDNLGALLSVNQIAVVPGDTMTYYHDGLRMGEKRQYLIRARKDGRPIAMSQLASATAEIPGEPWQAPPASRSPGTVGNLTAVRTASDENVISVVWDAPRNGASGYDVQYQSRPSGGSWSSGWTNLSTAQGERSYTFYNAGGNTGYRFQVRAFNTYAGQTNYGSWSSSGTVAPVATPNQVGNLIAARDTSDAATINVSWKAPTGGTTPTGYNVQYRSRAGNSGAWGSWNVAATSQTGKTYTLATATVADSYEFRVRSVTVSGGDTIYGAWRTAGIVQAFNNPDQVRNLTATRNFTLETTINVAWAAPGAGTTPTGYGVEYQENGGEWVVAAANQTDLTYDLTTAEGGKRYRFRVRAVTRTDDVVAGANASATATDCPSDSICGSWAYSATVAAVATPGQVGSLTATRKSDDDRKIDVTWTPPSNGNGATTYRIEYKEDGGAFGNQVTVAAASSNDATVTYQLTTATGNKTYQFQVRAVTRSGGSDLEGSWRSSNTVPVLSPPGQVGRVLATRQNGDETKIDFQWTQPSGGAPTGYNAQYRVNGTGNWLNVSGTPTVGTDSITHQLTGAAGQSTYQFRVRAYVTPSSGTDLTGSWRTSNTVPRVPTPGQVGSLTATRHATNDTIINVTWTAPSNATGATTYDIEYKEDNASDWTSAKTDHAASPYEFGSATGASRYVFRVRAVTESDGSDLEGSWRSSSTVPVLPAPRQVSNVSAARQNSDDTKIDVTWTPPGSGTTPTNYDIEYKQDGGAWTSAVTGHTASPYTFTHAGGGASTYQFQVRASTTLQSGDKLKGSWRTSNTVPKLRAPNQVGSVTATRDSNTETTIGITWTAPSGTPTPTGYDLAYKADNATDWTTLTSVGNVLTYDWTSAAGGSKYQFRVRAYKTLQSNTKLPGSWRTSNTVAGLPAAPITTVTATRNTDATTITVTWSVSARATVGYEVEYRKNTGSWQRATTTAAADRTHTHTNAGGVETYTFRVRGVSGNGAGPWKESGTVAAPDNIGYYGADVGVDWFTLKVTRGPWWFDYRDHKADWSSCRQVSNGNVTLTNLRPQVTYLVDIYTSAGCSANKIVDKQSIGTLSETEHPDKCWNTDDCRANDRPDDFNYHTHKRSYLGEVGVLLSGCNQGGKVSHNHTWPDGNGGWHWHCKTE